MFLKLAENLHGVNENLPQAPDPEEICVEIPHPTAPKINSL
jgi:hypothetical protein